MEELLKGAGALGIYVISALSVMLVARKVLKVPDELFRKILHFIMIGAYIPFVFGFDTWYIAAGFAASLIVVLYPTLLLAGKIPAFSSFVNERKKGEFKSSMVLAVGMIVFSISVCWGLFGDRYLVLACIYAWGVGDALAALIGKKFGKHKIKLKIADGKKSVEGSLAMFVSSAVSVFIVLTLRGGLAVWESLVISVAAAVVCMFVELISKGGFDTVSCPVAAMVVIIPLLKAFGG